MVWAGWEGDKEWRNRTTGDGFEHHRKQIPRMVRALQWKGRRGRMREMKYFELTIVVRCGPCPKGLWNRKSRKCRVFVKGLSVVYKAQNLTEDKHVHDHLRTRVLRYLRVLKLHNWLSFHEWEVLPMSKPNQQSCHSKSLGAWHYSTLLLWLSAAVWLILSCWEAVYMKDFMNIYKYINICKHNTLFLLSLYYIVKMDWLLYFVDSVHIKTKQKVVQ